MNEYKKIIKFKINNGLKKTFEKLLSVEADKEGINLWYESNKFENFDFSHDLRAIPWYLINLSLRFVS